MQSRVEHEKSCETLGPKFDRGSSNDNKEINQTCLMSSLSSLSLGDI